MSLIEKWKSARRAAVPLLAIATPDPQATMEAIAGACNGSPVLAWDILRGCRPLNDAAKPVAREIEDPDSGGTVGNPAAFLAVLPAKSPPGTVAFLLSAHEYLDEQRGQPAVRQGVWNLRDPFKADRRCLVMLMPTVQLPACLKDDVVVLDEPLPGREELEKIVRGLDDAASICAKCRGSGMENSLKCTACKGAGKNAKRKPLDDATLARSVDAVAGLSSFAAEQAVAMNLRMAGIDLEGLWDSKRKQIEQTQGLSVDRSNETFTDAGGLLQAKAFGEMLFGGPHPPAVVIRLEEIEKTMAGAKGDLSGTSQDSLQVVLSSMEDYSWAGMIAYGPPGTGKSYYSKLLAKTFGAFALTLDLNATKGSLVGQSEAQVRQAMKIIRGIGNSQVFFVATCNRLDTLPPELRRRFRFGVWFFDMPDAEEREAIWRISLARYGIDSTRERPKDADYSAANIRDVCEMAWRTGRPLSEVARFILPSGVGSKETIAECRKAADGRYLSASYPGPYRMQGMESSAAPRKTRQVAVAQE